MFTNVIVSSDEHFSSFFPIVYYSWKKFFPEVKISACFITNRSEEDPLIIRYKNIFDYFKIYPEIQGIPSKNLAKLFRFVFASEILNEVSMIEDVDTIPLQRDYFFKKTEERAANKILAVGRECYINLPHCENFPVSTITGDGVLFKELFNPDDVDYKNLLREYEDICYNRCRSIRDSDFSDETFINHLSKFRKFEKFHHVTRDVDTKKFWIDRSSWNYDKNRLFSGDYVTCNFKRPFKNHIIEFLDIISYISGGSDFIKKQILDNFKN